MSRLLLNQSRMFMRKTTPSFTHRALFSTGFTQFQQKVQQPGEKNITHFGFRDVAEEEKESLGTNW